MNLLKQITHFTLLFVCLFSVTGRAQWMQWECRSNLSMTDFSDYVAHMKERGYAPVNMSVVSYSNEPRVSSIWQKADISDWACWHGMNQHAFVNKIKEFNQKGLSPIDISVWKENAGELRFAAIWQRANYDGIIELDVNEDELDEMINKYSDQGYSPRDINGYSVDNEIMYACVFDKQPKGEVVVSFGNDEPSFQKEFDKNTALGFVPIDVHYFNYRGAVVCSGIWTKQSLSWDCRKGFTIESFERYLEEKTDNGFVPVDIDQYSLNGVFYYGATLTKQNEKKQNQTPAFVRRKPSTSSLQETVLNIPPVQQQTTVWCWLAAGEMIFKHFNLPNVNPGGNYQCGIIGTIFYNSVCNNDCMNSLCIRPSGSNYNTLKMLKDFPWLTGRKVLSCREGFELSFSVVKNNIDQQKPILCGISPNRRLYYQGAEHAVLLIGYKVVNLTPYYIINDPFPYSNTDNPYLKAGANKLQNNQYLIRAETFTKRLFWHWSLADFNIQ